MSFNDAMNIARNVPNGTAASFAAEEICRARGVDPWALSPAGVPNWQAVIIEQVLAAALIEALKK